ncbi:MAG: hypothetical protein ACXAC7_13460 [Candidatus Hodarchaeales archaeon]|jgi:hypothetical protein
MVKRATLIKDNNKKFGKRYNLEDFEKKLLPNLEENSAGLKTNQIATLLDTNRNTAAKYLKTLEALKRIYQRKVGTSKLWYVAQVSENLNLIGPNIIVVNSNLDLVKVNNIYASKIKKMPEEIIGTSIWRYNPFKTHKKTLEPYIRKEIKKLEEGKAQVIIYKENLRTENGSVDSISLEISKPTNDKTYSLLYLDLNAQRLAELELLNHQTTEVLLKITSNYFSIHNDQYKIIKVSQNVLDEFNNGKSLLDDTKCYDFYHKRDKPCLNCPSKRSSINLDKLGDYKPYCSESYPIYSDGVKKGHIINIKVKKKTK